MVGETNFSVKFRIDMSEHGAALQTYNQELVKCLEDMKCKRKQVQELVHRQEAEMSVLQKNLLSLQEKMAGLNESLQNNRALCQHYDSTISDAEMGFRKILESSQALLQVIQQNVKTSKTGSF